MADPDLQIRGGEGGGGSHPDPELQARAPPLDLPPLMLLNLAYV